MPLQEEFNMLYLWWHYTENMGIICFKYFLLTDDIKLMRLYDEEN